MIHTDRSTLRAMLAGAMGLAALLASCSTSSSGASAHNPAAYVEGQAYDPSFDPANFSDPQPNPWFPLEPGTTWIFEGGDEHVEVTVTDQTRVIDGITAIVVTDQVFRNGELVEDTVDWYGIDNSGNVWYLGERTAEYENGQVTTTAGSWETGVDGAQPGIIMLADPQPDDQYRQEYLAGEAEDLAKVIGMGEAITVPAGSYDNLLRTEEWTPLDQGVVEHKWYAQGVGFVHEETMSGGIGGLDLVEIRTAP